MDELPHWSDEALRPEPTGYPEATPEQHGAAAHLRAVHDMYRRGLADVGMIVDAVAVQEADPAEARAAIHGLGLAEAYQRLGGFCGQLCSAVSAHHAIEDAHLYPPLRAADPDLAPALDRLAHEHEVIHEVLVALDRAVVEAVSDPGSGGRLLATFRHLRALLESHFDYEERAIGVALGVHRVAV